MKRIGTFIVGLMVLALFLNCNPTSSNNNTIVFTDSVTDADGNVYHAVTIGTQTWTVENLKTTHYNDGTAIPNVTDNSTWNNLSTGAYCWYNNDSVTNKKTYGALYNWYAVNTGKLAPAGWHVPTDAEWDTLSAYFGGDHVSGGALKDTGTTYWKSPNTGATNRSGFSALPGGSRDYYDLFYYIGNCGYWWSATAYSASWAYYRFLSFNFSYLYSANFTKSCGFSVRLVRDN
jgi:uncharacterized protein (TIGR02145 family)